MGEPTSSNTNRIGRCMTVPPVHVFFTFLCSACSRTTKFPYIRPNVPGPLDDPTHSFTCSHCSHRCTVPNTVYSLSQPNANLLTNSTLVCSSCEVYFFASFISCWSCGVVSDDQDSMQCDLVDSHGRELGCKYPLDSSCLIGWEARRKVLVQRSWAPPYWVWGRSRAGKYAVEVEELPEGRNEWLCLRKKFRRVVQVGVRGERVRYEEE